MMTTGTADRAGGLYRHRISLAETREPDRASRPCPVCGTSIVEPLYDVEDCSGRLVLCLDCGTARVDPLPTSEELAVYYSPAYYGEGGRKFNRVFELLVRFVASRHLRFLSRRVRPRGRILDVGCGRGTMLSGLARRGFEAHGTEISADAAAGADPRAKIRIAPVLAEAAYPDDFFDQVIIWHVLEHLPDPRETLQEIHRILRPGGEVIVAVPNFSSWQAQWAGPAWFHLDLPRHLYHFPAASLRKLLHECGFACRSEHHFSLRQNPFGWVQSWLNKRPALPRNGLYELLLQHPGRTGSPTAPGVRVLFYAVLILGLPLGLALEIIATLFRRGATVHLVARLPAETDAQPIPPG